MRSVMKICLIVCTGVTTIGENTIKTCLIIFISKQKKNKRFYEPTKISLISILN